MRGKRANNYWRRRAYRAERDLHEQRVRAAKWREAMLAARAETKEAQAAQECAFASEQRLRRETIPLGNLRLRMEEQQEVIDAVARKAWKAASRGVRDEEYCRYRDEEDDW